MLWAQGKTNAAVCLERLWDDVAKQHELDILCAYPASNFPSGKDERDPDYPEVLQQLTSTKGIDFIFEEASELGPTTAEDVGLPLGGYLDVDQSREHRQEFGIAKDTSRSSPLDPCRSRESLCWHMVAEHRKRELLWLQRIEAHQFKRALLICGIAHMLSFSYRLMDRGYEIEAVLYEPRWTERTAPSGPSLLLNTLAATEPISAPARAPNPCVPMTRTESADARSGEKCFSALWPKLFSARLHVRFAAPYAVRRKVEEEHQPENVAAKLAFARSGDETFG